MSISSLIVAEICSICKMTQRLGLVLERRNDSTNKDLVRINNDS